MRKILPISLFFISILFFVLGLTQPIMRTTMLLLHKKDIYLLGTFQYFYEEGELFIAVILLIFTFILPIFKYFFLGLKLLNITPSSSKAVNIVIEIINKWAMLDVFVVALIIINLKMNSTFVNAELKMGTSYFAASILLMMFCSMWLKYNPAQKEHAEQ